MSDIQGNAGANLLPGVKAVRSNYASSSTEIDVAGSWQMVEPPASPFGMSITEFSGFCSMIFNFSGVSSSGTATAIVSNGTTEYTINLSVPFSTPIRS